MNLRKRGVTVVACPTCGRLDIDNFVEIVTEVERRLAHVEEPLHLSIMGCAVNGPGEAHDSQLGITFGRNVGMIFKDGVPMRRVAGEDIVEEFVKEVEIAPQRRRRPPNHSPTKPTRPDHIKSLPTNNTNYTNQEFLIRFIRVIRWQNFLRKKNNERISGIFLITPKTSSTIINVHRNRGAVGHIGRPLPRIASSVSE